LHFCDIFGKTSNHMNQHLETRIEKIKQLKDKFNLDQQNIANHTNPKRTRETVAHVLIGQDERYLTESNVCFQLIFQLKAYILNEYRKNLCK
jgi:hypothetical protein